MHKDFKSYRPVLSISVLMITLFVIALSLDPELKVKPEPIVAVAPVPNVNRVSVPNFSAMLNVKVKKKTFFDYLQPFIDNENAKIMEQRRFIESLQAKVLRGEVLSRPENARFKNITEEYGLEDRNLRWNELFNQLLRRIDILPSSLVLAQAANESAWGSSRFAQKGKNFFGQWCYVEGCGIVPSRRSSGDTHEVKRFEGVGESVHAYFMNLNTFTSYKNLREIREDLRSEGQRIDGISLSEGLRSYSSRGEEYIWDIQRMIHSNNLKQRNKVWN